MKYLVIKVSLFLMCLMPVGSVQARTEFQESMEDIINMLQQMQDDDENRMPKTTREVEKSSKPIDEYIVQAARRWNIDPNLIHAIISIESAYNPDAVSEKGALGLMQLMPETAKEMGVSNPFNVRENIHGGTKYFRMMLDKFGASRAALIAYHCGPGNYKKGRIPKESQHYAETVMQTFHRLKNKK